MLQNILLLASIGLVAVLAGPGMGPPPFLRNLDQQQRQQYMQIAHSQNMTQAQIDQRLDSWARNIGGSFYQEYQQFEQQEQEWMQEKNRNLTQAVQQLPQVVQRLQSIMNNRQLTMAQEDQQIRQYLGTLTNPVLVKLAKMATMPPPMMGMDMMGPMGGMDGGPMMGPGMMSGQRQMGGPMNGGQNMNGNMNGQFDY